MNKLNELIEPGKTNEPSQRKELLELHDLHELNGTVRHDLMVKKKY